MKIFTYNETKLGVLAKNENYFYPFEYFSINYPDMLTFIKNHTKEEFEALKEGSLSIDDAISIKGIKFEAPIPHPVGDVICLGINYMEHVAETNKALKRNITERKDTVYFSKRVDKAVGHLGAVNSHKDFTRELDYEAELALIIGKDCKNVSEDEALEFVFGYTILNDVSARDIQYKHNQWFFGKSLDTFCPMGPYIVTKDEIPNPHTLNIKSYVNGELRQNNNTKNMIFSIPYIISELSKGMTLKAGTVISTGTPSGVGVGFDPPRFLKPGDIVECEIEKIGVLRNKVI